MKQGKLLKKADVLPREPGVYLFKDSKGRVLYIGKAKNLRSRVKSYFSIVIQPQTKTAALVSKTTNIDIIEVRSEFEALILEAKLIKKHRPLYNVSLKDDKSFLYIVIREEKIKVDGRKRIISKVLTARETDLLKNDIVFGPYPDGRTAKSVVKAIRRIFPYRDCSISKFNRYKKLSQPCLYGHIGLCQAPCVDLKIKSYQLDIKRIEKLLSGQNTRLVQTILRRMKQAIKEQDFEDAAAQRDLLKRLEYISTSFTSPEKYIENPYLIEDLIEESLDDLVVSIPVLTKVPERIECYDISNILGKEAAGAMIVAINGRISKKDYRKFRVKLTKEPNDVGMMKEVIGRRLNNLEKWGKADLIVVDGGKGQVSAALEVLQEVGVNIPVVGLTKRFENIVYKKADKYYEIKLDRESEGLKLLQRLRDEAHRFAQAYHHKLRKRKLAS